MQTRSLLLILLAYATSLPIVPGAEPAPPKRPNILFILVDDQSPFDLKVYNSHSKLDAPHIERLAREGMTFDGAYHMGSHSGAVCTPSRHMIMSGRTLWHLPIAPNGKLRCPPDLPQSTIPAVFNRAGYDTMRTCKQGNSYEAANKLFTVRHDATKRGQFDNLFRHLAFKDPNTGLYSQQRIDVDSGALLLGPGMSRADLRALIAEGFLGSVDYLFWDEEDPTRVTLKVSHESFIRGWARFRALIDAESAHFEEFLGVLRKCADWSRGERGEDFLLEAGELRRLGDSGFARRLREADKRSTWRRFLGLDRDGERLTRHEGELDAFFAASQNRQSERLQRDARLRLSRRLVVASTVLFALLPTALFSVLVQGPTMRRAELLFDAGNRANRATLNVSQSKVGDAAATLDSLLRAAELVESARQGEESVRMEVSRTLLQALGSLPLFNDQRDFLASVFTQAEPPVNGTLRQLMTGAVWRAPAPSNAARTEPWPLPELIDDAACATPGRPSTAGDLRGRLFVAVRRAETDTRPLRALLVPQRPPSDRGLDVFSASVDPVSRQCTLGTQVLSSPEVLDSRAVFDAGLRYFYYTVQGPNTPVPAVIVQEVDWERSSDGQVRALQRETLASITDPQAIAAVVAAAGEQRVAVVPAWLVPGGLQVSVAGRAWRIVSKQAQRIELPLGAKGLLALRSALDGSACPSLAQTFAAMPGFTIEHLETESHCVMVARGWPALGTAVDPTRPARDEIRVAVHERPTRAVAQRAAENPPAPVAGLVPFSRLATDAAGVESGPWFVGTSGPYAGWLMLKTSGPADVQRFIGAPWSTCALWRLGRDLQPQNPSPFAAQAGVSGACATNP